MIILLIMFLSPCILYFLYKVFSFKPNSGLNLLYGRKGSGKSVFLARIANRYRRPSFFKRFFVPRYGDPNPSYNAEGRIVYSNVPIAGCVPLPVDFYKYSYPAGSVLLIDEGGIVFNSRSFSSFPKKAILWFKLQRHIGVTVWLTSQAPDVDLIIRNLADAIYIIRGLGFMSYMQEYKRKIVVQRAESSKGSGGSIVDDYVPVFVTQGLTLTINRLYYRLFDSFEVPKSLTPVDTYKNIDEGYSDVYQDMAMGK